MKIFKKRYEVEKLRKKSENIAFIPTMGALHSGHISMIKKARRKKQKVLVSIFVNPRQFNSRKDFINYPNNLQNDKKILRKFKINYLFLPTFKEIYSFKTKNKIYLHKFQKRLCGNYRPGHFKGVIDVVNRFLEIINPKTIYLGEKDFQQLFLIKMHILKNKISTQIVSCKTIRNNCGLAFSSRIYRLSKEEVKIACKIINILRNKKKEIMRKKLKRFDFLNIKKMINNYKFVKIEYIEAIDLKNLKKIGSFKKNLRIFVSYYIKKIRLIDNF